MTTKKNNCNGKGKNSRRSFDSLRSLRMTISILSASFDGGFKK